MKERLDSLRASVSAHPSRKWLILSAVLLGATMSALDVSIVNVTLPTLKTTFGVSMRVIEWVPIAYMLTLTVFLPLFGRLADLYGRSKLYNLGFVVFSIGSLMCGLSATASFMILSRVVQAVGAGLLQANSVAVVTHVFPANERGKAIGIQGAVQAAAMAAGPFFGGILITSEGWRSIFYVNIPIGIIGTIAALLVLPRDENGTKGSVDYAGAVLFASGLAGMLLALNEVVKYGWESDRIITYFASGVVLLTLFVVVELRVKQPLIDLRLFKSSTFLIGNVSGILTHYALFAVIFFMPFYLERVRGCDVARTGALLTPLLLAMALAAPFAGHLSDRYGARLMTTAGMVVSAVACLGLLLLGKSAPILSLEATFVLMGLGMGMFIPSNNSAIMNAAPAEKLGVAGGLLNMTRSMGLIFGVNISGMLFTTLEHRYLAQRGFRHARLIFSNARIPLPLKADAFMHGLVVVILVVFGVNILVAALSALRTTPAVGFIDHDVAGAAVISSSFLGGFSPDPPAVSTLVVDPPALVLGAILLLTVVVAGHIYTLVSTRLRAEAVASGQAPPSASVGPPAALGLPDARSLAIAYYANKYHDRDVSVDIWREGNHEEADVRKYGFIVKSLTIRDHTVQERRTWIDQFLFAY